MAALIRSDAVIGLNSTFACVFFDDNNWNIKGENRRLDTSKVDNGKLNAFLQLTKLTVQRALGCIIIDNGAFEAAKKCFGKLINNGKVIKKVNANANNAAVNAANKKFNEHYGKTNH